MKEIDLLKKASAILFTSFTIPFLLSCSFYDKGRGKVLSELDFNVNTEHIVEWAIVPIGNWTQDEHGLLKLAPFDASKTTEFLKLVRTKLSKTVRLVTSGVARNDNRPRRRPDSTYRRRPDSGDRRQGTSDDRLQRNYGVIYISAPSYYEKRSQIDPRIANSSTSMPPYPISTTYVRVNIRLKYKDSRTGDILNQSLSVSFPADNIGYFSSLASRVAHRISSVIGN